MSLPNDFTWGYGTASYQIDGAINNDGRGPSIWNTFCRIPGKIADEYGAKAYRFSISWSRIIPLGGRNDPVNEKGLAHYLRFVDDLVNASIIPLVTLYQWGLPQNILDRYGGPLKKTEFVKDFVHYARLVFEALGSKVKHWTTFTEPHNIAVTGYNTGSYAPGRSSNRHVSSEGDGAREPWIVGHTILVAHGSVARLYRDEFNATGDGKIGITLNGLWTEPWHSADDRDHQGCRRFLELTIGWFADPIYQGRYPQSKLDGYGVFNLQVKPSRVKLCFIRVRPSESENI